jgi:hypothetical protein
MALRKAPSGLLARLPDIPPLHQTESKKILSGFAQALVSTSLREKNELLAELEVLWTQQNEKYEQVQTSNKIKRDELNSLKSRQQQMITERDSLRQNTSFFDHVSRRKSCRTHEELIALIKDQEAEILKFQPLNSKNLLPTALALDPRDSTRYFKLVDLHLRRAEELAWCYSKRLRAVETSQELNESVIKEFGSVADMIEKVKLLSEENEDLKRKESLFMPDSFVRRRKVNETPAEAPRHLAMVLRAFLESQKELLEQIDDSREVNGRDCVEFDRFVRDSQISLGPSEIDFADFGNSVEMEEVRKSPPPSSDLEKLKKYREIVRVMENMWSRLLTDLQPISPSHIPTGTTRIEKVNEDNYRLLIRIRDAQAKLDGTLQTTTAMVKKLMAMIKAHNAHFQSYITLLKSYRSLRDSHILAQNYQSLNNDITTLLVKSCLSTGLGLLRQDLDIEMSNYLRSHFAAALDEYIALQPKPVVVEETPEDESKEPDLTVTDPMAFLRHTLKRSKRGRRPRRTSSQLEEHKQAILTVQDPAFGPTVTYSKAELVDVIFMALRLGGHAIGVEKDYFGAFHSVLNSTLRDMSRTLTERIRERERDLAGQLREMNLISHSILVRGKCAIAVQTDPIGKADASAQEVPEKSAEHSAPKPKKKGHE